MIMIPMFFGFLNIIAEAFKTVRERDEILCRNPFSSGSSNMYVEGAILGTVNRVVKSFKSTVLDEEKKDDSYNPLSNPESNQYNDKNNVEKSDKRTDNEKQSPGNTNSDYHKKVEELKDRTRNPKDNDNEDANAGSGEERKTEQTPKQDPIDDTDQNPPKQEPIDDTDQNPPKQEPIDDTGQNKTDDKTNNLTNRVDKNPLRYQGKNKEKINEQSREEKKQDKQSQRSFNHRVTNKKFIKTEGNNKKTNLFDERTNQETKGYTQSINCNQFNNYNQTSTDKYPELYSNKSDENLKTTTS